MTARQQHKENAAARYISPLLVDDFHEPAAHIDRKPTVEAIHKSMMYGSLSWARGMINKGMNETQKQAEKVFENKTLGAISRLMMAFGVPLVIWIVSSTHDDITRQNASLRDLGLEVKLLGQSVLSNRASIASLESRVEYREIADRDFAMRDVQLKDILRRVEDIERRLNTPPH